MLSYRFSQIVTQSLVSYRIIFYFLGKLGLSETRFLCITPKRSVTVNLVQSLFGVLIQRFIAGEKLFKEHHDLIAEIVAKWRERLEDISCFKYPANKDNEHR